MHDRSAGNGTAASAAAGSPWTSDALPERRVNGRDGPVVADDTVAGACSPRSGETSVVDDEVAEIGVLLHFLDLPAKRFRPWTDSRTAPRDGASDTASAQKPEVE